ncbi:hypothetical protein PoMZ_13489 [Pyricularia oryzae]|uniref:Uncharacterized protein n=1 Tax=Pyricularia oryzae TaxID=318829 RepID=A0A4P7NVH3_PYROR|nr:hypothetical protein PoMZ_13489 [Pyricularia oryzae]
MLNNLSSSPNTKRLVIPIITYNKIRYNIIPIILTKLIIIHNIMEIILPTTLIHYPHITVCLRKNVLIILIILIHVAIIGFIVKIPNTDHPVMRFYAKTKFLSKSILKTILNRFFIYICPRIFTNTVRQNSVI